MSVVPSERSHTVNCKTVSDNSFITVIDSNFKIVLENNFNSAFASADRPGCRIKKWLSSPLPSVHYVLFKYLSLVKKQLWNRSYQNELQSELETLLSNRSTLPRIGGSPVC